MEVGLLVLSPKFQSLIANTVRDHTDDWRDRADDLRESVGRRAGKFQDRMNDTYSEASDRLSNAAAALRGESRWPGRVMSFVAGIGVGSGLALLFAPASGRETREAILDTASSKMRRPATSYTGTEGD
jgi:gas vesicle protein